MYYAHCSETHTLSASQIVVGVDEKGKPTETGTMWVDQLILTSTEVGALQAALAAPPAA